MCGIGAWFGYSWCFGVTWCFGFVFIVCFSLVENLVCCWYLWFVQVMIPWCFVGLYVYDCFDLRLIVLDSVMYTDVGWWVV